MTHNGMRTQLSINAQDFSYLRTNDMAWAGIPDWESQVRNGRFAAATEQDGLPSLHWRRIYWFDSYTAVILARSFLDNIDATYEVASDEWAEAGSPYVWVILTDYDLTDYEKTRP